MKTIYLERLSDKELDMTLDEYLNRINNVDDVMFIEPNQIVLLNLNDRYFIGTLELNSDVSQSFGKHCYNFNGYYIFQEAIWENKDTRTFTSTMNNTIILQDSSLLKKVKNLIKNTVSFRNNILHNVYNNTNTHHTFKNDNIVTREQFNRLNASDKLCQCRELTLREILKIKNAEYDVKYKKVLEEIRIGKEYMNNMMFNAKYADKLYIPITNERFDCVNFTDNGFYTEIYCRIIFNDNYRIITNKTDEYNIRLHIDNIRKHLNEIKEICKQSF